MLYDFAQSIETGEVGTAENQATASGLGRDLNGYSLRRFKSQISVKMPVIIFKVTSDPESG